VLTVIRCNQLSSVVIRRYPDVIRTHSEALQRYSKVHQKTPVFLIKYFHNKDLKKINNGLTRIFTDFFVFIKFYFTQYRDVESPIIGRRCAFDSKRMLATEVTEDTEKI
jgi:hypothetical protein